MKVSERIKGLRTFIAQANISLVDGSEVQEQLIQLEVDVVCALQAARYKGYSDGFGAGKGE